MPTNKANRTDKKIFISTGELSGETHALHLVEALRLTGSYQISAMGSDKLASAGSRIICDYKEISVTGLSEVASRIFHIKKAINTVKQHLSSEVPDLVILVDFPGFNMRIARFARSLRIPVVYFIPPQVWAWHSSRMKKIREYVDMVVCILPFERDLYAGAGIEAVYVGHPFAETVKPTLDRGEFLRAAGVPDDRPILTIMPGSRENEIRRHMPVMVKAADIMRRHIPGLAVLLPLAGNIGEDMVGPLIRGVEFITLLKGGSHNALAHCDAAIVASGSATLEAALLKAPTVIIYRISRFSYAIARIVVRIDHIGLPNIIAGKEVFPEFIQHLEPEIIAKEALSMIHKGRQGIAGELEPVIDKLLQHGSYNLAAAAINNFLGKEHGPVPETY